MIPASTRSAETTLNQISNFFWFAFAVMSLFGILISTSNSQIVCLLGIRHNEFAITGDSLAHMKGECRTTRSVLSSARVA